MNTIKANSINELQKLLVKKSTKLFLTGAVLIPLFTNLLVSQIFITDWMDLPEENIHFVLLDLFVHILLPLFIFITATDLFTGDSERGTLFPVRPISRMELFLSKTMAIGILILIQLLIVWLSVMTSSALINKGFHLAIIPYSFGAFVVSLIPLMVITAFAVLMALVVHSSTLAISSMIVLYVIMEFIPYVLPDLLYLLPVSYLDWYTQLFGNISTRWILQTITYLGSAFVLFFTTGYYMFSRKEA